MKWSMLFLSIIVTLCLCSGFWVTIESHASPIGRQLSVGFATRNITPEVTKDKPVYMAGFGHNRIAEGVNDPLFARAVVLSDGEKKIALVSLDIVGLFFHDVQKIRDGLSGFHYVLVNSTHNHEGPDTMGLWGSSPVKSGIDPIYIQKVISESITAIKEAEANLTQATASWGKARAPELLHDGRIPEVKQDELFVLRFQSTKNNDATLGILVNWHCHPETLDDKNMKLSADYVGFTVEQLSKKYRCPVAYFTGVVGGLMTSLHVPMRDSQGQELKDGTLEKTREYGYRVATLADDAILKSSPVQLTPLYATSKQIYLPLANPLYRLGRTLGVLKRQAFKTENGSFKAVPDSDNNGELYVQSEVAIIQLGEVHAACIPGEIYPEIVIGGVPDPAEPGADFPDAPTEPLIFKSLKSDKKMVFGLANDELGYILPKRQWDDKPPYCYGRKSKQYGEVNSIGPEAGPIICGAIADLAAKSK